MAPTQGGGGFGPPPGGAGYSAPPGGGDWSPTEPFAFAVGKVKDNPAVFVPFLVAFVISIAPSILSNALGAAIDSVIVELLLSLIMVVVGWAVTAFVLTGVLRAAFKLIRGGAPEAGDVLSGGDLFAPMFIAYAIYAIASGIGVLLCIVPGLAVGLFFNMAFPLIVDRGLSPIDALKESVELVKPEWVNVLLFGLIAVALNFVGALLCGVGLLVTVPLTYIAWAWLYQRLTGQI
jgi:hypothetical protein